MHPSKGENRTRNRSKTWKCNQALKNNFISCDFPGKIFFFSLLDGTIGALLVGGATVAAVGALALLARK
jgi:hypothetical protein